MTNKPVLTDNLSPAQNLLRVEHQKIKLVSMLVTYSFLIPLVFFAHRLSMFMVSVVIVVGILFGLRFFPFLIYRLGLFSPKGPFVEDIGGRSDDQILLSEFVRLGGRGSSLVASKLSSNLGKSTRTVAVKTQVVVENLQEYFMQNGVLLTDNLNQSDVQIKGLIGCGVKQLNPTLVTITLFEKEDSVEISVQAMAKEGLVKQHSGEEAAERISKYIETEFGATHLIH